MRNFAHIVYEYTVSGQKLRNDRVSIGEDLGNFEVAETIARYPVGTVVTVYYNPRRPRDAVLERDAPKGLFGCVIWMVVIGIAGILGSFYGFNQVTIVLTERIQNAPMVVALSAMGLVAIRCSASSCANRAPTRATGRWRAGGSQRSEVNEFRGRLVDDSAVTTLYRPLVSFAYEYNGVTYVGSQVSLGVKVTSNSAAFAKKTVGRVSRRQDHPACTSIRRTRPSRCSARHQPRRRVVHLGDRRRAARSAYFVSQQA